jgi:hypothetical protein
MSRNKFNSATNFLNSDRVLESQSLRNQNKKYISIFGPDNIINSDIKRSKILLSKNQNIIKNYDKTFIMIEKLNDNKSYFALKRELNNEMKKNKKLKKFVGNEFSKHHLNLKNFKYLINEQHDKQNDDEKFMYNFMNHLENRKKPKKKIRYSQILEDLINNNSRNRKRKSILNKMKENNYQTHTNFYSNTVFSFNSTTAVETNNNFFSNNNNNNNKNDNDNEKDKKHTFFTKQLNKKLFNILNIAKNNENLIEKSDKKLKKEIIFNKTENNFFKKNNNNNNQNESKINQSKLYYNDKSKFSYPIINKIIYQKMKKTDAFENAKNMFIEKYLEKKELMKEFLIEREREKKEMEEYLKEKEEEEKNKLNKNNS